ncbi:hypothetical protein C8R43DRAFT_965507 [Mycena crocata]|nr:hypothetical protein C8R43DRAFT_965507 [Mycena crocata]
MSTSGLTRNLRIDCAAYRPQEKYQKASGHCADVHGQIQTHSSCDWHIRSKLLTPHSDPSFNPLIPTRHARISIRLRVGAAPTAGNGSLAHPRVLGVGYCVGGAGFRRVTFQWAERRQRIRTDGGRRIEGARTAVSLCWRLAKAAAAGEKLEVELSTEVRVRCEGLKAEGCVDCEGEVIMGCTHGGGVRGAGGRELQPMRDDYN